MHWSCGARMNQSYGTRTVGQRCDGDETSPPERIMMSGRSECVASILRWLSTTLLPPSSGIDAALHTFLHNVNGKQSTVLDWMGDSMGLPHTVGTSSTRAFQRTLFAFVFSSPRLFYTD